MNKLRLDTSVIQNWHIALTEQVAEIGNKLFWDLYQAIPMFLARVQDEYR